MNGFIETGRRTYPKSPVPPASASPRAVTFSELFAEAQNEETRHRHSADRLSALAADPANAAQRGDILECAQTRVRLTEVYGAFMKLVERCRDDTLIRNRLGLLAREAAERDAEMNSLKNVEGDDDAKQ